MFTYSFLKPGANLSQLQAEIAAAGLPISHINGSGDAIHVVMTDELTPFELATLEAVVTTHDGTPRRARTLFAIRSDLNGLTNPQKLTVWSDLSSGSPPKWATDAGPNAAAIAAIEWAATVPAGVTVAEKTEARLRLVSMYVQDNPDYLVHPAFDGDINVPGDEPDVTVFAAGRATRE